MSRACAKYLLVLLAAGCGGGPAAIEIAERPTQAPAPAAVVSEAADTRGREQVRELLTLVSKRLALMDDVARSKWNSQSPVSDPQREEELLRQLVREGERLGVRSQLVQRFFTAQFAAARERQQGLFDQWQSDKRAPFAGVPDLLTELRPQIAQISREQLAALSRLQPVLGEPDIRTLLQEQLSRALQDGELSQSVRERLLESLVE
jgi:chorismate mutase